MTYSYDRTAAANFVVKQVTQLRAKATKAVHTYGKASDVWRDYISAVKSLEPSFNSMDGRGELEGLLRSFRHEIEQTEKAANAVTERAVALFQTAKEVEEKVKASPRAKL
jgi:hypothetical protein